MYPILIDLGPIFLPAWHAFFVLGAFAAYFYMLRMRPRVAPEISETNLAVTFVFGYVGGYFGARALSILTNELATVNSTVDFLRQLLTFGAMTFYGGFIGSALFAWSYARFRRLNIWALLDLALPAGILGLAVGRIGCFLNGDDYGRATSAQGAAAPWWSVVFPNLGDGVARIPVQLLEMGVGAVIAFGCVVYACQRRFRVGRGYVGLAAAASYAVARFFLEFWRGDPGRGTLLVPFLSTSQTISIAVLLGALAIFFVVPRKLV